MSFEDRYTGLDRAIHRLAFLSPGVQLTAAGMEDVLYRGRFRDVPVDRPVFVTSLPRAGTTLLLELLHGLPPVATHCYRDMPFVMAPLLWDGLSARFRKPSRSIERAHGDGMAVGYDSPEAFEEALWRAFWPEKYASDRIGVWSVEDADDDEFHEFLRRHMQKVVSVRAKGNGRAGRYVSKNNANVVRIGLLKRWFPDGILLVPFRHPVEQAVSLLNQHTRFLEVHRKEAFSKRYMADIGHLEFGELHRPIAFEGLEDVRRRYRPDSLDYWVAYWAIAFEHVLERKDDVVLVSYEALTREGAGALGAICRRLDLAGGVEADAAAATIRAPRLYKKDGDVADKELLSRAYGIHSALLESSIV